MVGVENDFQDNDLELRVKEGVEHMLRFKRNNEYM